MQSTMPSNEDTLKTPEEASNSRRTLHKDQLWRICRAALQHSKLQWLWLGCGGWQCAWSMAWPFSCIIVWNVLGFFCKILFVIKAKYIIDVCKLCSYCSILASLSDFESSFLEPYKAYNKCKLEELSVSERARNDFMPPFQNFRQL